MGMIRSDPMAIATVATRPGTMSTSMMSDSSSAEVQIISNSHQHKETNTDLQTRLSDLLLKFCWDECLW